MARFVAVDVITQKAVPDFQQAHNSIFLKFLPDFKYLHSASNVASIVLKTFDISKSAFFS